MKKVFLIVTLLSWQIASAQITLDGQLNEAEWEEAKKIEKLLLVNPYVLSQPAFDTEVRVFSNPQGIYFGIINTQPVSHRNTDITGRDQRISSDKNEIIIDFDNNGITAYGFEIGSGGSIRDGIWSDENNFSPEWDGNWQAHTSSHEEHWVTEVFIPWDIVAMKKETSDTRTIRWYFSRYVVNTNQTYASVATNPQKQRFISEFIDLDIADFATSSIQLFGYATVRNDFIEDEVNHDIGLDTFWKSGSGKQLSLTVNPDFGQIESDNLVVNFEPTEVFFNERRPFFTENQSLFDVRGAERLRILNTRRIGSTPDNGDDTISDIDAAIKYTDNRNNTSYGLFAASESSGSGYKGRDYYAGRFIYRTNEQTFGLISTYTNRPDIDRHALVASADHEYRWNDQLTLNSQLIMTDIDQLSDSKKGWGGYFQLNHQISSNSQQQFEISHYDRKFDIQDFGYLPRNNLNTLQYSSSFRLNNFSTTNTLQESALSLSANFKRNDDGKNLGSQFNISNAWSYKNATSFELGLEYLTTGKNDLFSRGNGLINTDPGYSVRVTYRGKNTGKLRYHQHIRYTDTFLGGRGVSVHLHPSYYFKDNYYIDWQFNYTDTQDWLKWNNGAVFGAYHRKFFDTTLDFNANISQRQELRLRFQWLAIDATGNQQLLLKGDGNLIPDNQSAESFNISNTALQIRYRYEISPLSNIYVVYSRGGSYYRENEGSLFNLANEGWDNVDSDNFLVKVRYKFY